MTKLLEIIRRLRDYYEEFIEALRDYENGEERVYAVERLAQLIAQSLLNFAAILASREKGRKPETYRGLAKWLSQRLGLQRDLAVFLEGLAGFRNILVHMYAEIDEELEREAFHEIAEKMPEVIKVLEEHAANDPCIDEVKQKIQSLARRLQLRYVLLFGSLARHGCGRDVDLAIRIGYRPRSMLEIGRLQVLFEEELGARVDLVVLDIGVSPSLAKTIVDEAVLVYGDPREAEEDLLRLYKQYLDYQERLKSIAIRGR